MAKSKEKLIAIKLRREGKSIKEIASFLNVSKGSASLWCRDIVLTKDQIKQLNKKMKDGNYLGRLRWALLQKELRQEKIQKYISDAAKKIGRLTKKDLLLIGLGLHLGEGTKGHRQFRFSNSNKDIIKLIIKWLVTTLSVKKEDCVIRIFINESHRQREIIIKDYWSNELDMHPSQFRKTIFIKSKTKKMYPNHNTYFGVVSLEIKRSSNLQYQIYGLQYHILQQAA